MHSLFCLFQCFRRWLFMVLNTSIHCNYFLICKEAVFVFITFFLTLPKFYTHHSYCMFICIIKSKICQIKIMKFYEIISNQCFIFQFFFSSRFIINSRPEEIHSTARLFFLIENAFWFYLDFHRVENPRLKDCQMKEFAYCCIL